MTTYSLTLQGRTLVASGPSALLAQLARMPEAKRDRDTVRLPVTREAILIAEALGQPQVDTSYKDLRRRAFRPSRDQLLAVQQALEEKGIAPDLLPHQWEFLAHALPRSGMLNASEQGLGKTRMALVLALAWGCQRIVVAMPKDLARQWADELSGLVEGTGQGAAFVDLTKGTKAERALRLTLLRPVTGLLSAGGPTVIAVNYEVLRDLLPQVDAYQADCFIFDESWKIKNPTAKVTKAAIKLTDKARARARGPLRVLCLSGTPVGNDIGDLWGQLRVLGPDAVKGLNYRQFLWRFAVLQPLTIGTRTVQVPVGISDPIGLMRLVYPVWFRATKETCLDLPPKAHQTVILTLPPEVRVLYEAVEKRGEQALGKSLALTGAAVKLLRLQQLCGGTEAVWTGGDGEFIEGRRIADLRVGSPGPWSIRRIASPKLEWLVDWMRENVLPHPHTRVIVWCRFNAEVERIEETLRDLGFKHRVQAIWGDTLSFDLEAIKYGFNSRDPDGTQVIVAQVRKLFNGHNLQGCDWNIDFSLDWSHIVNAQKEDRSHRMGRTEEVNYIRLVCQDTVDEDVLAALDRKAEDAGKVTPGTATNVKASDREEREN